MLLINKVQCTLWGEFAEEMNTNLNGVGTSSPPVIVLQLCKMKRYHGIMGISNAFYGTKLFINSDIEAITEYKTKMESSSLSLTQSISQISAPPTLSVEDDFIQTPQKTISELLEATDVGFAAILAQVIEIDAARGWYYESCYKCYRKVTQVGTKYFCRECKRKVTAVPRFKVDLTVIDSTGSTNFLLFDRVVSQFLGVSAQDLLAPPAELVDPTKTPDASRSFFEKTLLFKVAISASNITQEWNNYTVRRLCTEPAVIKKFKEVHGIQAGNHEEELDYNEFSDQLANDAPLINVDDVGSNNTAGGSVLQLTGTPTSKLASNLGSASTDPSPVGVVEDANCLANVSEAGVIEVPTTCGSKRSSSSLDASLAPPAASPETSAKKLSKALFIKTEPDKELK